MFYYSDQLKHLPSMTLIEFILNSTHQIKCLCNNYETKLEINSFNHLISFIISCTLLKLYIYNNEMSTYYYFLNIFVVLKN